MHHTFSTNAGARHFSRRRYLQAASALPIALLSSRYLALAQDDGVDALPEFPIVAVEYSFDLPAEAPSGWTQVTLDNQGTMDHHAMLLKLRDPDTLADLEDVLQSPDFGAIFALADSVGGAGAGPGSSASVLIDLEPGQYMAVCVIPDDDGTPHYLKGQQAPFSVTENDATNSPPSADLSVEMSEMVFTGISAELPSGPQIWEVTNTGEQLHELALVRLADGMTIDQGFEIFGIGAEAATPDDSMASMEMEGPPFTGVGGIAPLGPGQTNLLELDLAPGTYIAICFVPDTASGAPHFMLGMISGFTVA